jgi:hypothetical protein
MKKEKIFIIGGGLCGCLLAYMLSKKKYDITIFEKNKNLISSYDSVKIGKYKINNGFHGIELPRAKKIFNFFTNQLKIKFKILSIERRILFQRSIINFKEKKNEWPKNIISNLKPGVNNYKNETVDFFFKKKVINLFKINSKKFFGNVNDSAKQFLPWFLPSDINHISNDEGDNFRSNIRNNIIEGKFAIPKRKLFNIIKKKFFIYLKSKKVNIILNAEAVLEKNNIEIYIKNKRINPGKIKKIYYTLPAVFLIKYLNKKHFQKVYQYKKNFLNCLIEINDVNFKHDFSEILTLNKKIWFVNKIYSLNYLKFNMTDKKKYLIAEIILDKEKLDKKKIQSLLSEIKIIFELKNMPKLIECKLTRSIFYLNKKWIEKSSKILKSISSNKKIIYNSSFYPLNMNKVWIQAAQMNKSLR